MLPTLVKFSHIFAHHEHEICLGKNQSHLHEIDTDCEFYKFSLGNSFYIKTNDFKLNFIVPSQVLNTEYHTYLKSHQQLSIYLRGPPNLT